MILNLKMQNNKIIYLITTKGCEACHIMANIMLTVLDELEGVTLIIRDVLDIPMFIRVDVPLYDFPTLVFIKDGVIKYHTSGTISKDKIKTILSNIGF